MGLLLCCCCKIAENICSARLPQEVIFCGFFRVCGKRNWMSLFKRSRAVVHVTCWLEETWFLELTFVNESHFWALSHWINHIEINPLIHAAKIAGLTRRRDPIHSKSCSRACYRNRKISSEQERCNELLLSDREWSTRAVLVKKSDWLTFENDIEEVHPTTFCPYFSPFTNILSYLLVTLTFSLAHSGRKNYTKIWLHSNLQCASHVFFSALIFPWQHAVKQAWSAAVASSKWTVYYLLLQK